MITNNRLSFDEYQENFADIHPPFQNREGALIEANRCLMCYDAPCTKMCPTHINIPKFIKQIATDNVKGSAKTIFTDNIMGASCSKVCPVEKLCEGSCVYNLLHEEPIQIARLQRYSTEKAIDNNWQLFERKTSVGKKVAIVGAGPAGLAAAIYAVRKNLATMLIAFDLGGQLGTTYEVANYPGFQLVTGPDLVQKFYDHVEKYGID